MGNDFFIGYSGNTPNIDKLMVICLVLKTRHIIDPTWDPFEGHNPFREWIKKLHEKGNPFLDERIYTLI